ncbi:carbamoyl phosphate synthase small subunit, partial [bacterium]
MKRYLVLGDGSVYEGRPLGAEGTTVGEVVFNTGMTGYQEILTDPSYAGQIVLLTYPLIGNYGVNDDDFESDRVQPTGLIVKEAAEQPSNWRATSSLDAFLKARGTVSIQGLDTRLITKRLRNAGVTMGAIAGSPEEGFKALQETKDYGETDFVDAVSTVTAYKWGSSGKEAIGEPDEPGRVRLAVLDCGLKHNILRRFYKAGCRPIVFPSHTTADEIMAWKPDGILL